MLKAKSRTTSGIKAVIREVMSNLSPGAAKRLQEAFGAIEEIAVEGINQVQRSEENPRYAE
jgi:hypothetical protein